MPSLTKSALWGYNIERYLRDHPGLSPEAQAILREGIGLVSAPAWFDIGPGAFGYEMKTMALDGFRKRAERVLSAETIYEVFIRLGREPEVAAEPRRSPGGKVETHGFSCSCGSYYDCGRSDRDCFGSWCFIVYHCGFYSDEPCWGNCKSTQPS
ncbi:MAG TPA: bacteriocin fulvocin C-related protein [Thermoanaerobaculia bacterium]|nr:bacteriocin fulvocin C-related protein [Thermoanaerobaculia bacterium]